MSWYWLGGGSFFSLLVVFQIFWLSWPFFQLKRLPIPDEQKQAASKVFQNVVLRAIGLLLVKILAPKVVFIALLFTPRSANKLPAIFQWWDNDVSINGDDPKYWDEAYEGTTYYANAHPRSFWARWVWMGWRNPGARLAQMLGHTWADKDAPSKYLGAGWLIPGYPGWTLISKEGLYQMIVVKKLTGNWYYHCNFGYKIWAKIDHRPVANIAVLSCGIVRAKGE